MALLPPVARTASTNVCIQPLCVAYCAPLSLRLAPQPHPFIDNGVPVYIGEAGCGNRDGERAEAFRRYYLSYVWRAAADRGIAITYWDNGYNTTGNEGGVFRTCPQGTCGKQCREYVSCYVFHFFDGALLYMFSSVIVLSVRL